MPDRDHRFMEPPSLVLVDTFPTGGASVTVWALRIAFPNMNHVPDAWLHSLEHCLNVALRAHPLIGSYGRVMLAAPMGCATGMYLVAIGIDDGTVMAEVVASVLSDVTALGEVPLADEVHCGWVERHSLSGARSLAAGLLRRREKWPDPGPDARELD